MLWLRFALILLASVFLGPLVTVRAQKVSSIPWVTRGAYLQIATPTSMIVRWETAQAASSSVHYGLAVDRLDGQAGSPGHLHEHVVLLPDLQPNTRYYYAIGSSNRVLQQSPSNYFLTPPQTGSEQPVRVWVLGDPGTASPVQKAVRDAYTRFSVGQEADLILTLGDNAYPNGTKAQFQRGFFDIYREPLKHTVLWPSLGNHDTRSADSATEAGVYFELFTLPRRGQAGGTPSGTAAYYSFDHSNVHFLCLNSEEADLSPQSQMITWLKGDLAVNRQTWTIAYWHHPPYSKGSHDSDEPKDNDQRMGQMRENVLPWIEAGDVDLVLCGHSHLYERSFLLQGWYGDSTTHQRGRILDRGDGRPSGDGAYQKAVHTTPPTAGLGTVFVNTGSAGHATKPKHLHGLNHPVMFRSLNVPGSFVLDISGLRLNGLFIDERGNERDNFTLSKAP